jgi:hypothetical protein
MKDHPCLVHCPRPGDWGAGTALTAAGVFLVLSLVTYEAARIVPDLIGVFLGLLALAGFAAAGLAVLAAPVLFLVRQSSRLSLMSPNTVAVVRRRGGLPQIEAQNEKAVRVPARQALPVPPRAIGPVRVTAAVVPAPEPGRGREALPAARPRVVPGMVVAASDYER